MACPAGRRQARARAPAMTTPAPVPVLRAAPAPQPVSWVPSRKVLASFTANVLTLIVALAVTKLGLHESATTAGMVSAAVGIAAGGIAGYLVREIPRLEADVKPAATKM